MEQVEGCRREEELIWSFLKVGGLACNGTCEPRNRETSK